MHSFKVWIFFAYFCLFLFTSLLCPPCWAKTYAATSNFFLSEVSSGQSMQKAWRWSCHVLRGLTRLRPGIFHAGNFKMQFKAGCKPFIRSYLCTIKYINIKNHTKNILKIKKHTNKHGLFKTHLVTPLGDM